MVPAACGHGHSDKHPRLLLMFKAMGQTGPRGQVMAVLLTRPRSVGRLHLFSPT